MTARPQLVRSMAFRPWGMPAVRPTLIGFRCEERLSDLYRVEIEFTTEVEEPLEEDLLGEPATLLLAHGQAHRAFHGVVSRVHEIGARYPGPRRMTQYRAELVPRMWLLGLRRTSRIFQEIRVDEVIRRVLGAQGVVARFRLEKTYPSRRYITQYEETDLDFVRRLAAECGWYFQFEHPLPTAMADHLGAALATLAKGDALAGAVDAAFTALSSVPVDLPGELGDVAARLSPFPREVVVFSDSARGYAPMTLGEPPSWESVAADLAREGIDALGGTVEGALAGAVGAPLAGALGDLTVAGARTALGAASARAAVVHLRSAVGGLHGEDEATLFAFERSREVVTRRATYREYDPERPRITLGATRAETDDGLSASPLGAIGDAIERRMAGVGVASSPELGLGGDAAGLLRGAMGALTTPEARDRDVHPERPLEIYEHHSPFLFPDWEYEEDEPERILKSARRHRDVGRGHGICPWLEPGRTFQLEGDDITRNNRAWAVIAVTHVGRRLQQQGEPERAYESRFECVPADVPYVPARPRRRTVQTCLTATVVAGDPGGIETNRAGQIRVRFHWDRERRSGGTESCWIRVMQQWAGAGFGWQFVPRHGMEVVVGFEGGDPDRPLVLGCVYNATNPTPFPLPSERTRSGLRTRSTTGGGGNELSFEDAAGREQIRLYAERDYDANVQNDRAVRVGHDDVLHVHHDHSLTVEGRTRIDARTGREAHIALQDRVEVDGQRSAHVRGNDTVVVDGDRSSSVGGASDVEVHGRKRSTCHADLIERVEGNRVAVVGTADAPRTMATDVQGEIRTHATERVELVADKELVMRCGRSVIRLSTDRVTIESPDIGFAAKGARLRLVDGEARVQADSKVQAVSENVVLRASGASLGLSSDAALDGARILLKSPAQGSDQVSPTETRPTTLHLCDESGQPFANQPYRILLADGREITGALDDEGCAELDLDDSADVSFPGLQGLSRA